MHKLVRKAHQTRPLVIGMIHLDALPGTPNSALTSDELVEKACEEAKIYSSEDVDGLLIENMCDIPYTQRIRPEVTTVMTRACLAVKDLCKQRANNNRMIFGVQVLAAGNKEALAIALAAGFDFIRAEGYVFAHVADEGLMQSCAGELLRYRRSIGADHINVITDIKKKHSSHSITGDVTITETAKAAEFFASDGVIITGKATGDPPDEGLIKAVKTAVKIPVVVGSGVDNRNAKQFATAGADALIVGSYFKDNGHWKGTLDRKRISTLINALMV